MRRIPRSLGLYIAASTVYAAAVFLAVHAVYGVELGRAGLDVPDPAALLDSIDVVSFVVWLGLSLIAGTVLHRVATALEGARDERAIRDAEIASVFAMSQALSGSLDLGEIAAGYLRAARQRLDPSVTIALLVHDDVAEAFRTVAEEGPGAGAWAATYSVYALPAQVRTRVVDHRQSLVIADSGAAADQWEGLVAALPELGECRSFAALPLVSHDRLVGIVLARSPKARALEPDRVQLSLVLGQFVAGAIRTTLSLLEAEARADREAIVGRIASRAHSALDPDRVLGDAVEELGRVLRADRAVAATGASPDALQASYQWAAPGVARLGRGHAALPVARFAAQSRRTAVFRDVLSDPRLADARDQHAGARAFLSTPIVIGGELAGTLTLHQLAPRDWTAHDIRLIEAVAREVRVAMETARLFQSRQRENERLLALHRASAAIAAQSTTREVLDEVLQNAAMLLGRGTASLYTWDESSETLLLVQNFDPERREVTRSLRRGEGLAGHAFAAQAPLIVNEYQRWEHATEVGRTTGLQAALAVPLARAGRQIGALVIRSYDKGARFTDDEARLLTLFGDQAAAALVTAETFARQRQAVEQLERLNRAKSEFVSIVSHEFRTPLTGIQGFSEMMRDEELSMEEMREYAGDINKDAQRLTRMINELLDLDRMEAGRMTIHRERMDLNALVADVADRVRPNAPNHPITLDLDGDLVPVEADRDRMTQVVSNLLNNAVKYSPTGGRIIVTTRREGEQIHLTVRDEGLGIPVDSLETIFERYSRVESQATRDIKGTGLGLPIVRQIMTLHGGRVWAESELGRGSTFHVLLPMTGAGKALEAR